MQYFRIIQIYISKNTQTEYTLTITSSAQKVTFPIHKLMNFLPSSN